MYLTEIERERERVYQFCSRTDCGKCPLRNQEWEHISERHNCLRISKASTAELDRAIKIFVDFHNKRDGYNAVFMVDETEEVECDCENCKYCDEQYDDTVCRDCKYNIPVFDSRYENAPLKWTPATSDPVEDPVNPYWDRITAIANRQRSKGIKEYGRGVEDDTADINVRLDRIEEELVDTLMYLEHLRDGINNNKEVKT